MKISDFIPSRDNNFNLIRIIAAYAVLITHSFALAIGTSEAEPFHRTLGMTMGSIAVDVFFITSGFLVTASLLTRQSTVEFIWARALRIFPALFAMLLLTVIGFGLFFTTLPWSAYFTDPNVHRYFIKCLTLISGVAYELPGVFENNPYKNSVNGSLWTLPYEIKMYIMLAILWGSLRITPVFRPKAFKFVIVLSTVLAGILVIAAHFHFIENAPFLRLFFMFFSGSTFFILKDRIVLSHTVFTIFAAALLLASLNHHVFFVIYIATLAYLLFYIAYIPTGFIRHYNKLGDYSYGVYIYAFPVQQSTAALFPGISVLSMILVTTVVTFTLAILSWHLLEKHALKLKGSYVNHTQKLLSTIGSRYPFPNTSLMGRLDKACFTQWRKR